MYESNGRTLGETVPLLQPDVEDEVHTRIAFWKAFARLSIADADVISLLMFGHKFKDIEPDIGNARYRIKIAKKRFREALKKEGIECG